MKDISLNIQLTDEGLKFFNDGKEQIAIIRFSAIEDEYKVICASFDPFGKYSTVKFIDNWYAYASRQIIADMTKINLASKQNANLGKVNIFTDSGFSNDNRDGPSDMYGILNQRTIKSNLIMGLAQEIIVNNVTGDIFPTCVNSIPINQTDYIVPSTIIWILAAKGIESNMVISSSMLNPNLKSISRITIGDYLEIDLKETITIHFDDSTNVFKTGSLPE